jgi:transcriptional regulator with XRE-family HTH domain
LLTAEVGWVYQTITNEQGLHADDLAVHLDMNRGHLTDIERGKREAGIITLQVIARGLDTTMANLLNGL